MITDTDRVNAIEDSGFCVCREDVLTETGWLYRWSCFHSITQVEFSATMREAMDKAIVAAKSQNNLR